MDVSVTRNMGRIFAPDIWCWAGDLSWPDNPAPLTPDNLAQISSNNHISRGAIPPSSTSSCSFLHSRILDVEPPNHLDLLFQPSKVFVLWRIKRGGLDLHLHQRDFHFPLIHLRDLSLGFPCGEPRHLFAYLCYL